MGNAPGKPVEQLYHAARKGDADLAKCLRNGVRLSMQDRYGQTALHHALSRKDKKATAALLKAGAPVDVKDVWGNTPLHAAAQNDSAEAVALILEEGAYVDARNELGLTAAHVAAFFDSAAAIAALVEGGAVLSLCTTGWYYGVPAGSTVEQVAKEKQHAAVLRAIETDSDDSGASAAVEDVKVEELPRDTPIDEWLRDVKAKYEVDLTAAFHAQDIDTLGDLADIGMDDTMMNALGIDKEGTKRKLRAAFARTVIA